MIRISTKYFWLTFMFSFFKPWLLIDGQQTRLNWGDNVIPVPPGVHQLTIWIPYLWKVGEASLTVDTSRGETTVFYAAPAWAFGPGAIGFVPQKHPNQTAALIVSLGIPALIILLCCCGIFLSSMNGGGSTGY
jgi:hypothetical protein